jgi:hypothetical protein
MGAAPTPLGRLGQIKRAGCVRRILLPPPFCRGPHSSRYTATRPIFPRISSLLFSSTTRWPRRLSPCASWRLHAPSLSASAQALVSGKFTAPGITWQPPLSVSFSIFSSAHHLTFFNLPDPPAPRHCCTRRHHPHITPDVRTAARYTAIVDSPIADGAGRRVVARG